MKFLVYHLVGLSVYSGMFLLIFFKTFGGATVLGPFVDNKDSLLVELLMVLSRGLVEISVSFASSTALSI